MVARVICEEKEMLKALSSVKGVASVTSLGQAEEGAYDFSIVPKEGFDIRGEVFKRVSERGKTLLSLSANNLSLEQIFLRLTEASNDQARKMLGFDKKIEETEEVPVEISEETVKEEE